jgi:hypothetical protein
MQTDEIIVLLVFVAIFVAVIIYFHMKGRKYQPLSEGQSLLEAEQPPKAQSCPSCGPARLSRVKLYADMAYVLAAVKKLSDAGLMDFTLEELENVLRENFAPHGFSREVEQVMLQLEAQGILSMKKSGFYTADREIMEELEEEIEELTRRD